MKKILETYFELRKSLVQNKLNELELNKDILKPLSPMHQLKEFRTLNLDFGRQNGSSYFILDWLTQDNHIENTVLYTHSLVQELLYKKELKKRGVLKNPIICNYKNYDGIIGVSFKYVIVDISACLKFQDLKNINNVCAVHNLELMLHM